MVKWFFVLYSHVRIPYVKRTQCSSFKAFSDCFQLESAHAAPRLRQPVCITMNCCPHPRRMDHGHHAETWRQGSEQDSTQGGFRSHPGWVSASPGCPAFLDDLVAAYPCASVTHESTAACPCSRLKDLVTALRSLRVMDLPLSWT